MLEKGAQFVPVGTEYSCRIGPRALSLWWILQLSKESNGHQVPIQLPNTTFKVVCVFVCVFFFVSHARTSATQERGNPAMGRHAAECIRASP
jgi:hypothetical protein